MSDQDRPTKTCPQCQSAATYVPIRHLLPPNHPTGALAQPAVLLTPPRRPRSGFLLGFVIAFFSIYALGSLFLLVNTTPGSPASLFNFSGPQVAGIAVIYSVMLVWPLLVVAALSLITGLIIRAVRRPKVRAWQRAYDRLAAAFFCRACNLVFERDAIRGDPPDVYKRNRFGR